MEAIRKMLGTRLMCLSIMYWIPGFNHPRWFSRIRVKSLFSQSRCHLNSGQRVRGPGQMEDGLPERSLHLRGHARQHLRRARLQGLQRRVQHARALAVAGLIGPSMNKIIYLTIFTHFSNIIHTPTLYSTTIC